MSATTETTPVAQDFVGDQVSHRDEVNGYVFWGLVTLFIGVPELLAAFSNTLKADIPWPTISNLVGKHLERRHHWVALLVVALIVLVTVHTLTYPAAKKKAGRAVRDPSEAVHVTRSGWYIVLVAATGAAAGVIASALGANKIELGYAIYVTLTIMGVVVPSALAYWWNRVLAIPTLFAALAYLRRRAAWAAALVVALLVVLLFHLALYPWPNYQFGGP
ncbi:MAG: hypothetical protein ACJ757_10545 [Gaiellaceae bacterium]